MKYLLDGEETERLYFRNVDVSQFEQWLPFHQDPRSSEHWIADMEAPEIECKKWFKKQDFRYKNDMGGMNALIEKKSGKLVGYCGLLVQSVDGQTELEIGYSILPEFWKRGFASEAARKCRDTAFKMEYTDSLISIISLSNTGSAKVALNNGMQIEKTTIYNENRVNIFRIHKKEWEKVTDNS
ncbi:GNAT family N-acetyltransferase [Leptobacterium flavescens]|uniref:GNAT family N-acetyltransferase n=1 Tax=Leptobacterium flavescens TaxID=472055 RepID=A0A6P0UQ08_9FLAO|nr:GNAT family N-acetyltransferase [Leptobacterium flavescens]NER15225.1 GNAT family N-acetyltransferase [Leptobacterium flavescens]